MWRVWVVRALVAAAAAWAPYSELPPWFVALTLTYLANRLIRIECATFALEVAEMTAAEATRRRNAAKDQPAA